MTQVLSGFTDVPRKFIKKRKISIKYFVLFFSAPPTRPDRFHSRDDLKHYLQLVCFHLFLLFFKFNSFKVHEYYAIIGRPRFGRRHLESKIIPNDVSLFNTFDKNGDKSISYEEFHELLGE